MRLFVGVEIDVAVVKAAGALVHTLRLRAAHLAPRARITWIPEDRMHLTVRFIGNTDDGRAAAIQEAMGPSLPLAPFPLDIGGTGAFPATGKPRVFWAGLGSGREQLEQVEGEVARRLASVGIPPEERPYSPHLTLARVKDAGGLRASRLFDGLEGAALGTTSVGTITLFESRLSPKGPTYVPLLRTRLESRP